MGVTTGSARVESGSPPADAQARLAVVRRHAELRWRGDAVLLPSHSNDTWRFDDRARGACVLRICRGGDPGRLITEAKVGRALPAEIGYPEVLGYGWTRDDDDLTWCLTRRLSGYTLAEAWGDLDDRERERAGVAVARKLRHLHRWRPSAAISDRLLSWPRRRSVSDVIGATINPLPLARVRALVDAAEREPGVDTVTVRRAYRWLVDHDHLTPRLDRPGLPVLHSDLHLANIWWDGKRVSGLIDLEWARLGEPHLDRSRLMDAAEGDHLPGGDAHRLMLEILAREYPELCAPGTDERVRFYRIAYLIRDMFVDALPDGMEPPPGHPSIMILDLLG